MFIKIDNKMINMDNVILYASKEISVDASKKYSTLPGFKKPYKISFYFNCEDNDFTLQYSTEAERDTELSRIDHIVSMSMVSKG